MSLPPVGHVRTSITAFLLDLLNCLDSCLDLMRMVLLCMVLSANISPVPKGPITTLVVSFRTTSITFGIPKVYEGWVVACFCRFYKEFVISFLSSVSFVRVMVRVMEMCLSS